MKKLFKPALSAFFLALFLSLVIYACKKPTEGLNIIIKTDALSKSPTLLEFVNANPQGTAIPAKMSVDITDPKKVVQTDDGATTNFTAYNGLIPLSLIRTASPSVQNPVTFTTYAAPAGFIPVVNTTTITSDTAAIHTVIPMIEYAHPPNGASIITKTTPLTSGTSAITTLLLPATAPAEACTITIAAGTQFKDKNGAIINSTSLASNVIHLGTTSQDAYNAFPGGFNPANVIGPNGAITGGVTFLTAGLVSINMVAGSTVVKGFSKPLTVNMGVNADLINPLTGVKVKVGDAIPVWSMDESTGQWTYEASANVVKNTDGTLAVIFPVTHLSAWSLNWYGSACGSTLAVTINIPGLTVGVDGYEVALTSANYQYLAGLFTDNSWSHMVTLSNGFKATMPKLPSGLGNVKVVIYSRPGDPTSKVAETDLFSACSKGSVSLSFPTPVLPDVIKSHVSLVARCLSKQVVANPTTWLTLKDVTDPTAIITTYVHMIDGAADIKLVDGHSYTMGASYNSKNFISGSFKIDKTSTIKIPSLTGLSGTAVYNANTKTIAVNTTFTLGTCG
jgi:hypothetical protein